jgi:DNA mismatch repair protein MutL
VPIRLLDRTTVGQIAAGEVVERPLSVVKELVENSLDAGASRIVVAVERGGLDAIEVSDDGAGIAPAELELAFARHATSKLSDAADLTRIATLGFRGEGLASIAAVAHVRLVSRTALDEVGYATNAFELSISKPEPVAAAPGTRVTVRELFANVPARREYLRTPAAEFTRISNFLATLALGYPHVAFSLAHDGRSVWAFPEAKSLEQRLAHVFGYAPARDLLALEGTASPHLALHGFVSKPGTDRADRRMQHLFVNGRLLRSNLLAGAWSGGYATFAQTHRYPFGVLFLEVPADRVDPNVHPTKSDVRLRSPNEVVDGVRRAISATLARDAGARLHAALSFAPPSSPANGSSVPYASASFGASAAADASPAFDLAFGETPERPAELRILAQLDDTFILATDGNALVLVDQHAAHERVAFEAIARRGSAPRSEPLLIPYTIELDADDALRFEASLPSLAEAGLEAEPFGERTFRVTATPAGYAARAFDVRGYIEDLGDEIRGLNARERVWASLACHSVVRAGDSLEPSEMSALLARLQRCENPMHCPHGRPTIVRIEAEAIARMFKRSW